MNRERRSCDRGSADIFIALSSDNGRMEQRVAAGQSVSAAVVSSSGLAYFHHDEGRGQGKKWPLRVHGGAFPFILLEE